MDKKQYMTYEVMCCSFLLGIFGEGHDKDSNLWSHLGRTFTEQQDNLDMALLIEQLKVHGAQDQLLMFLTGPVGAGKSTSMKVVGRFCFEFCFGVEELWTNSPFLFTDCTRSAAMQVCDITICKVAFLLSQKLLTDNGKNVARGEITGH